MSGYMAWAKTRSQARRNLATSGVLPLPLAELGAQLADLELTGPSFYGYEPLQRALAEKCGAPPECVVAAVGTTLANLLSMAALVGPGDHVVLELPVYEPLLDLTRFLGAEVDFFPRRAEDGFRVDPAAVAAKLRPATRLVVLTSLHNPSGARVDEAALRELGALARGVGARVLVDEVYLELDWVLGDRSRPPASAFHLGSEFVVTSSLTKAYGLSGLRCGWILAEPELTRRMWELYDLVIGTAAHAAERLSVVALARLGPIADRAAALLRRNRALLDAFLDSPVARRELDVARPGPSTVVFPRWRRGDVEPLCVLLRERFETTVVPGRFFGLADHFRLGIGGETEALRQGLERLGAGLEELGRGA
jgi:hypothetical protein